MCCVGSTAALECPWPFQLGPIKAAHVALDERARSRLVAIPYSRTNSQHAHAHDAPEFTLELLTQQ